MIYLASPYSHPDPVVRVKRYDEVCAIAAKLMAAGIHLYCPISHTHPIAEQGDLPRGWDYWREYDRWYIERCDMVVVAKIDGWSVGVQEEIEIAHGLGKHVAYLAPGRELEFAQAVKPVLAAIRARGPWEEKVWGRVQHVFDGRVAVSLLETVAGRCCSTHYHVYRNNLFYVVEGQIDVATYAVRNGMSLPYEVGRVRLARGMQITIPPGVVHRFEVVESGRVVEIYWADPPGAAVDINDIVRLDEGHVL